MARTAVGDSSRGPRDTKVANIIRSDRAPPRRTANSSNNPSSTAGALLALLILSVWTNPSPTTVHAFAGLSTRTPSGARLAGYRCAKALDPTRDREHRSTFSSRRPLGSSSGSSSVGGSSRRARPARAATTTTASSDADGVRTASSDELVDAAAGATSSAQGEQGTTKKQKKKKKERLRVTTAAEMRRLVSEGGGMKLFDLDARGDSQDMLEAREDEHPVLEVLRERVEAGTKPGSHGDGLKAREEGRNNLMTAARHLQTRVELISAPLLYYSDHERLHALSRIALFDFSPGWLRLLRTSLDFGDAEFTCGDVPRVVWCCC